jgi:ribose-phosphate pyrophosphokinase
MTPDPGGYPRASRFATALQKKLSQKGWTGTMTMAVFDKLRVDGKVRGGNIVGDVEDSEVVLYDDMISTGSTAVKAGKCAQKFGGRLLAICATHGLFVGKIQGTFPGMIPSQGNAAYSLLWSCCAA